MLPVHADDCEDQPLLSIFKKAEVEIRPEPDQDQWRLQVRGAASLGNNAAELRRFRGVDPDLCSLLKKTPNTVR